MLALLCIFCATAALELYGFLGAPGGLPAVCAIVASYLVPTSIASWIKIDAHERGKRVAYDFDTLAFILWPIVAPVYLFRTRGAGAFGPIAAFVAVTVLAYLFALLLKYPSSMKAFHVSDRSVIFAPEQASKLVGDAEGFWKPNRSDIAELETRLPAFIATKKVMNRPVAKDYKQYVGIVRGGRRFVHLDAFSLRGRERLRFGWWLRPTVWCGGGNSVWQVEFDPETKVFQRFSINGPL